jgi:hypothetical protein
VGEPRLRSRGWWWLWCGLPLVVLGLAATSAWFLAPRFAPRLVARHSPFPIQVVRAMAWDGGRWSEAGQIAEERGIDIWHPALSLLGSRDGGVAQCAFDTVFWHLVDPSPPEPTAEELARALDAIADRSGAGEFRRKAVQVLSEHGHPSAERLAGDLWREGGADGQAAADAWANINSWRHIPEMIRAWEQAGGETYMQALARFRPCGCEAEMLALLFDRHEGARALGIQMLARTDTALAYEALRRLILDRDGDRTDRRTAIAQLIAEHRDVRAMLEEVAADAGDPVAEYASDALRPPSTDEGDRRVGDGPPPDR